MKYTATFSQMVYHSMEIEAENRDMAEIIANNMADNGEVEFTADDLIGIYGPMDTEVCMAEYTLGDLWNAQAGKPKLDNKTRAFMRALDEIEDWAVHHGEPNAAIWETCKQFIDYATFEDLRFNSSGRII